MYIFQKYVCKEEENELLYKLYVCKDYLCINCLNEIVLMYQFNIYFVMFIILEKNLKKVVILFIYVYIYLLFLICILLIVVYGNIKFFEMIKKKKEERMNLCVLGINILYYIICGEYILCLFLNFFIKMNKIV